MSATVRSPSRASASPVCLPTPHSAATGSGCRKSRTPSAGTTSSPSGLQLLEAILAMNLLVETPTEQVIPSSATWALMSSPIPAGDLASRRSAPEMSRNASSRDSGSTCGVIARNIAMISRDTAP